MKRFLLPHLLTPFAEPVLQDDHDTPEVAHDSESKPEHPESGHQDISLQKNCR